MKKTTFLALAMSLGLAANAATINYTPDNTTIFKNPERGYTEELSKEVTDDDNNIIAGHESFFSETGINSETKRPIARPTETLVMVLYNLKNYRNKALTQDMLDGFDEDMQALRNVGFKCVLRFAYTEKESDKNDAGLARVQQHIGQLASHIKDNSDVIYALEAGFVGVWGEWYYSKYFGDQTQSMNADRIAVIDTLLKILPEDRFLLVRYPQIKTEYLAAKGIDTKALTTSEAYNGSIKARIGCHNDAFLNTYGDNGTYASKGKSDDPKVRQYVADETLYVPNGGETNVEDDDKDFPNWSFKVFKKAEEEMSKYHWSFCGESYAKEMTVKWHDTASVTDPSMSIFDQLNCKMGYRYQLNTATLPAKAVAGAQAHFQFSITNTGYAPLYNFRRAQVVLKSSNGTIYPIDLASDPRTWKPNGAVTNIDEYLTIPADVPEGSYQLYLAMPDTADKLKNDPRFAIRFANQNIWESSTGMNKLNASIAITKSTVTPPTPGNPSISVSATSISFGDVTVGSSATRTFTVSGTNLTNNITISSNNAALAVSPATINKTNASNATVTLTLTPAAAGNGNATVTIASSGATSKTLSVSWNGKQNGGTTDPTDAVILPATLDKNNKSAVSDDTWWTTDNSYYDFGSEDNENTSRYIEWSVYLKYPGQYNISAVAGHPYDDNADGFQLEMQLLDGSNAVSTFTAAENSWAEANISYPTAWDLSAIAQGKYTLRAKNIAEFEQPKLKSITLEYDGELPTGIENTTIQQDGQAYDLLGRPVDENYHGIVIKNGKKYIQ